MGQLKILHDRTGNTLTVWFGNPADEHICTETGDDVVLMKDINQDVIGIEIINFRRDESQELFTGEVEVFEEDVGVPIGRVGSKTTGPDAE